MRYIVIDNKDGTNIFSNEFNTEAEAVAFAEADWSHMTEREKKDCIAFYVIESVNPDPESEYHFDGNFVKILKKEGYFRTSDRETGTFIDEFDTLEEAEEAIRDYEEQDKEDGTYSEDFYTIVDPEHCVI